MSFSLLPDAFPCALQAPRIYKMCTAPAGLSCYDAHCDARIDQVVFASTSAPFFDRLHAGVLVDALHLTPECRAGDVAGSRRCAVGALLQALRSTTDDTVLVAAGEKRPTKAGSAAQLAWGDGGAAALI